MKLMELYGVYGYQIAYDNATCINVKNHIGEHGVRTYFIVKQMKCGIVVNYEEVESPENAVELFNMWSKRK